MVDTLITNLDTGKRKVLRYAEPGQTFKLATEKIIAAALTPIDPVIEDFLEVACAIFFADSSFVRGSDARPEMGVNWRRNFHIEIPVQALDRWSDPAVLAALQEVASFLTEDTFVFKFVQRDPSLQRQAVLDLDPTGTTFEAEEVIMFSGGLDSFAGALQTLSTTTGKVLLVSHRSAQKVMPRQDKLAAYLLDRFPNRLKHVKVNAHRISTMARDTTQRSRTLLFAALGHAVAQSFGARQISFYENGIVSHNLPVDSQVVGTMATRTTHPLVLHLLNELFVLLRPAAPAIRNGFAWLTKTEVVQRIAQHGGAGQIRLAVSCTSVREQTRANPHCGTCSQCLDRRFGVLAAGLGHEDPAEGYRIDALTGPRDGKDVTMAVAWSRHALRIARMTPMDLLSGFGPELSRIVAGYPTLSAEEAAGLTLSLHKRHAESVHTVLTAAIRDNAIQIAAGSLAPSSLLRLHIGSADGVGAIALTPDPRWDERRDTLPVETPQEDHRPDPLAPLEVSFFIRDNAHAIAVTGLCNIDGWPARIAHDLKPTFDEDRASGLRPEDHRFHRDYRTLGWNMSDAAIRKHVQRCRMALAESYKEMFGMPPAEHLLIQNKPSSGYRLDPLIRLTTPPH